ncbi:MAG: M20/M25/M40 family metallo-hydrolase, partial [Microgenomates group bacterium]
TPNQTFNKVPDEATISFDIRYIPEEMKNLPFEKGKKLLEKKIKKIVGNLGEREVLLFEPPQFTDQKNPFVLKLKQSVEKITGKKAKTIVKHGGSDIRHFNQVGCEGVTFGPIGGNLHGDDEWVEIKSLEKYYQILKRFLLSI